MLSVSEVIIFGVRGVGYGINQVEAAIRAGLGTLAYR